MNTKLSVDSFNFSSYPFRKPSESEKKRCSTEKDEKVIYRQHATKLFSILRLLLFSVIHTFEDDDDE